MRMMICVVIINTLQCMSEFPLGGEIETRMEDYRKKQVIRVALMKKNQKIGKEIQIGSYF